VDIGYRKATTKTIKKNNVMEIKIPLSPEKAASIRKKLEESDWGDLPIETIERIEEANGVVKYVLRYRAWDQVLYEKKRLERKQLEEKATKASGKGMSEVLNAQLAYRKATSPHRMTTKPTFRKGYRLVNHFVKIEKANRK
jgi:hypothetical protein